MHAGNGACGSIVGEGRQVAARAVVVAHAHRLVGVHVVEADRVVVGAQASVLPSADQQKPCTDLACS